MRWWDSDEICYKGWAVCSGHAHLKSSKHWVTRSHPMRCCHMAACDDVMVVVRPVLPFSFHSLNKTTSAFDSPPDQLHKLQLWCMLVFWPISHCIVGCNEISFSKVRHAAFCCIVHGTGSMAWCGVLKCLQDLIGASVCLGVPQLPTVCSDPPKWSPFSKMIPSVFPFSQCRGHFETGQPPIWFFAKLALFPPNLALLKICSGSVGSR